MLKQIALILLMGMSASLLAQDYLSVPFSRPEQQPADHEFSRDKLFFINDSLVYEFDTLSLPFIDDFTTDHFIDLVTDPLNDPRVNDTLLYAIRELDNSIYRGVGFVSDTTYTYTIDTTALAGDTVMITANPSVNILFYDIRTYPPDLGLETVFPPYNINDSVNIGADTFQITPTIIQDSIKYYVVEKSSDKAFYVDRSVYLNNTLGFYPPSIGVVSFDGLDQFGLPYNFNDITSSGNADYLTSAPIDLGGTSDSTYFSFYYQAKGFALDGPNLEDSLSLEFYNSDTKKWGLIWQTDGLSPTAAADSFRQVIVRVDSQFRTPGFQFRFRNRARLTGAYDHWNLDYLYLDDNRSINDTSQKDLAFVYPAPSMLEDYIAMPYWHFETNPANYIADSIQLIVRNNFFDPLNVFNKIVVPDTVNSTIRYIFPGQSLFLPIDAFGNLNLSYPLDFTYAPAEVSGEGVFKGRCDIDFRPAAIEEKDFIRANDTTFSRAVLSNYYAYDDGTAEAGYGINSGSQGGNQSSLALRFDMPFADSVGGVQMYFLPQNNDIRNQNFKITIWSTLNPATIIYQQDVNSKAIYGLRDGYITYFFDTLVPVPQTFYIGYEKVGPLSMNMGYDFNRNHRDKLFWSLDGFNWFAPSNSIRDGSVMIRPILRKKNFGVGLDDRDFSFARDKKQLQVYPNPAKDRFYLKNDNYQIEELQLFSFDGRLIRNYQSRSGSYSVEGLSKGVYLLKAIFKDGTLQSTKLMLNP